MADLEEPEADASELLEFLDQVEVSINRISVESERNVVDLEDLLLEAEALLQDINITIGQRSVMSLLFKSILRNSSFNGFRRYF